MFARKHSSGVTLIEYLIALILTLIIINVMLIIFCFGEKNFLAQKNILSIETNANLVKHFLRETIHHAGYVGCAKLSADLSIKNNTVNSFDAKNKIKVDQVKNHDSLSAWFAENPGVSLLAPMRDLSVLNISADLKAKANDMMLISDCESVDIFIAKTVENKSLQLIAAKPLSKLYGKEASVFHLSVNKFYLAKSIEGGDLSLFWQHTSSEPVELAQHVQEWQIDTRIADDAIQAVNVRVLFNDLAGVLTHSAWYFYAATH